MPKPKETDLAILQARKLRKRQKSADRMRKFRGRGKEFVTTLLEQAMDTVASTPSVPHSPAQAIAAKTAQAILKRTLRRRGVTVDLIVRRIAEGLNAARFGAKGDEQAQLPDMGSRLRTISPAIALLERCGLLPGAKEVAGVSPITVHMLVLTSNDEQSDAPHVEAQPDVGATRTLTVG